MTTHESREPGALSRLLEELAEVPRPDVPPAYAAGLRPGTRVGRFIIEREIGRGGFGVVYAALDPELGRTVALKLLKPGSSPARKGGEWLRREAEAVARLAHANIVTLYDFGRAPGGAYLVFELLRGETLAGRLTRGPLPIEELVHVGLSVARALAHAHEANVLHRDLKPANIFLCTDGTVKVLDFGIAHLFEKDGPSTGGTPAYMAPEQWRDETGDPRTDLFALGVLLHEMLTGTLPFGKRGAGRAAPALARRRAPRAGARQAAPAHPGADAARTRTARPASTHLVLQELEAIAGRAEGAPAPLAAGRAGRPPVVVVARRSDLLVGAAARAAGRRADHRGHRRHREHHRRPRPRSAGRPGGRRPGRVAPRPGAVAGAAAGAGRGTSAGAAVRIDGRTGRLLAELAGAHVLLVPSVRRDGEAFALQLRGEAPDGGAALFTASARAGRQGGHPGRARRSW